MNDVPFWLPGALTVGLTVVVGAVLLPVAEGLYRLENWIVTWPLPPWERAERRAAFEMQLEAFFAAERRKGYQAPSSGLRLLVRMLSTLFRDIWDFGVSLQLRLAILDRLLGLAQKARHHALAASGHLDDAVFDENGQLVSFRIRLSGTITLPGPQVQGTLAVTPPPPRLWRGPNWLRKLLR